MRRIMIVLIFLFQFIPGPAQKPESFAEFNKTTYQQYDQEAWSNLLKTGRQAIKKGYDFYYMRMRMGIAAYERKNYHRAILHFNNALVYSNNDPVALEYLYYDYLFSGRKHAAASLRDRMPAPLLQKIGNDKKRFLQGIGTGMLFFPKSNISPLTLDGPLNGAPVPEDLGWRSQDLSGTRYSVNMEWGTGKNNTLVTGYRYLNKDRMFYLYENQVASEFSINHYNQHQFFVAWKVYVFKNFYFNLSGNLLNAPRYATAGFMGPARLNVYHENDFTGAATLGQDFPYVSLEAGYGVSNLNGYLQSQQHISATVYPLGNLDLYLSFTGFHTRQSDTDSEWAQSLSGSVMIGARVVKPLWIQVYGSFGDRYNIQLLNGWETYNDFNPVSQLLGGEILINVPETKWLFSLGFYETRSRSYYFYRYNGWLYRNQPIKQKTTNYYGGLKWNF